MNENKSNILVFVPDFAVRNMQIKTDVPVSDHNPEGRMNIMNLVYTGAPEKVCPKCGKPLYSHGTRPLTLTDTPMFGVPTKLALEVPRRRCRNCGYIWTPELKEVDEVRKATRRAIVQMANRALKQSFNDLALQFGVANNTVKNIFVDFIREKEHAVHFETPAFLGLDEIKVKKIGEITVVTDLEHRTLYDMMIGRNQTSLTEYFSRIPDPGNVLWVCTDMYRPFEKTIKSALPNARWVIDHYHIVAYANRAMDIVRIAVQNKLSKKKRIATKKGLAYTLRTRADKMDAEDALKIRECRKLTYLDDLMRAFDLKEDFFNIYDKNPTSKDNAQKAFEKWEASIPSAPIFEPFRDLAKTVHNFYEQIFNYWDCPISITNGFTECTNRIIRENNVRGRGNSFDILRARTLYRNANLERLDKTLHGPAISKKGPLFLYEDVVGMKDDAEADLTDSFDSHDYDPLIGLIPGVNYDPETGEIFDDAFLEDDEEDETS